MTAADGHLYIVFSNGRVVLAKATAEGYEEVGAFELEEADDSRPTWAHPVILDGKLYIRQDDKIYCYDVRA